MAVLEFYLLFLAHQLTMQVEAVALHTLGQEPDLVDWEAEAQAEIVLVLLPHQTELPIAVEVEVPAGSLVTPAVQVVLV